MLAQALVDRNPLAMVPVGGEDEDGEQLMVYNPVYGASNVSFAVRKERIFIGLMTSDRKLKASREGSK